MRILIAEDDAVLSDGLTHSLRQSGYSVDCVKDGTAANALVKAAHEVCPYSNATRGNIDVALSVA